MALKQNNAELLLTKGLEQKVSAFVIPDESLLRAENVDFTKVGAARKRTGLVPNSNLQLNAGPLDEVRRLGSRQRKEVLCITDNTTLIGSAVGAGYAGDTLFSYSEEAQRWVARGKMPRPNLDVIWTSGIAAPGGIAIKEQMVTGGIENYVCVAHQSQDYGKIRVVVFDVGGDIAGPLREAPAIIIDTTFDTLSSQQQYLAGWAQAGDKVWLFFGMDIDTVDGTPAYLAAARAFRSTDLTFDTFDTPVDLEQPIHHVSSDGTNIFGIFRSGVTGYRVRKFNSELAVEAENDQASSLMTTQEMAIDARQSWVDIALHDTTTGDVYTRRLTKGALNNVTALVLVSNPGTGITFARARGNIQIGTLNETHAMVFFANPSTGLVTTRPNFMQMLLVNMTNGTLVDYANHMGLVPYAPPFIIDGRLYLIAMHSSGLVQPNSDPLVITGTNNAEESFMCLQIPTDIFNQATLPFPSAQWDWGNCIAKLNLTGTSGTYWMNGKTVYQSGTSLYVTSNIATAAGLTGDGWLPAPRLTRLEFGDACHRWRTEEMHDYAVFAGGIPFVYDGTRSYELTASLHQPAPLAYGVSADGYDLGGGLIPGGELPVGERLAMRTAMLYVDSNGRECWSQPSRIVDVTPVTPGVQVAYMYTMPVTLSVKPDMGNFSNGRLKLYLFVAGQSAPDEWQAAAVTDIDPLTLEPVLQYCALIPAASNTLMYTSGFELENTPPVPARCICEHSGRLFLIASDSNKLRYSKPFNPTRGLELGLGMEVPLPDKGTALASLNDRLVIFTHRSILVLQGPGPDVTGNPPDGYSRPVLVTSDYGCIEYCAAARTPLGVIFRGHQGFYLLGMGFEVQYIGAQVEDTTAEWVQTNSIVNDQKAGCCRIVGSTGQRTEELLFWYDTKRWSMNLMGAGSLATDTIVVGNNLIVATTDTTVSVASRHMLGTRNERLQYRDYGHSYDQVLETGWLTFQQAGNFKRIWRAYVLCKAADASSGFVGGATVRIQVFVDWKDAVVADREFFLDSHDEEPRSLRVHLKQQKMKAIKVRVSVISEHAGADIMKIGFELGMRQGGPKDVREQTQ